MVTAETLLFTARFTVVRLSLVHVFKIWVFVELKAASWSPFYLMPVLPQLIRIGPSLIPDDLSLSWLSSLTNGTSA
ncbi:hypothetical protein V6N12_009892 [Hibiscus sabdariffa]|uniref:Uncharacterized protein n=1 Tax=Hibiscus sabdariffa TaxID=183260 RepID=A0ABR2EC16_9ROSI